MKRGVIITVYAASILGHVGVTLALSNIEPPLPEPQRMVVQLLPPPVEAPAPPPEEPPAQGAAEAPEVPRPAARKPRPRPSPKAPPPPPALGVTLSNTSGPGGIAVPEGDPGGIPGGRGTRVQGSKRLGAAVGCAGETRKPKAISMPHPQYTSAAREAGIEGRVRVEITVGPSGEVQNARIISSLGHGLDEAALESARAARFDPALECGRAVSATFVVSIRFTQ